MKTEFAKKRSISLLVCIMVLTTALSFAFWAANIMGGSEDKPGDIQIGSGRIATTSISLSNPSITDEELVPLTVTPISGETHTITIAFTVKWIAFEDPAGLVDDETESILTVECISIMAGEDELLDERTTGDAPLFMIDLGGTAGVYSISGNADDTGTNNTDVTITVQLNEPVDEDQFFLIAGKTITLTFTFTIDDIEL